MTSLSRLSLVLLLLVAAVRAGLYLDYAYHRSWWPLEAFNLEAKMVHLAWRVQAGVTLYPEWRSYPHVANFFAPLYFVVVGWIGRGLDADLDGLYGVGRAVTCASTVLATVLLGVVAGRRYGRGAGWIGGLVGFGVGPQVGFGVMARPDALADLLGVAGYFAAVGRRRWGLAAGGALLVLAGLTKQTCAVYLGAAAVAVAAEGRRRAALALLGGCGLAVAIVVAGVAVLLEPHFVAGLLGEARSPWDWGSWRFTSYRIVAVDPEWVVLAAAGLVLWNRPGRRDLPATVLAVVLIASTFVTVGKRGSDLNYALGLRAVGALAAGAMWEAAWSVRSAPGTRLGRGAVAAAGFLAGFLMLYSVSHIEFQARNTRDWTRMFASPSGRAGLGVERLLYGLAADPARRILTDDGAIDIRQKERTAFGDPWLFHMLAETGQLDLSTMLGRVEAEEYDWLITTKDIFEGGYKDYDFGLPIAVIERARRHYRQRGDSGSHFLYGPLGREVSAPAGAGP